MASTSYAQEDDRTSLNVPLLQAEEEIRSVYDETLPGEGDIEQGGANGSDIDASHKSEDHASRAPSLPVPGPSPYAMYTQDLFRLLVFYWSIVADALLLKELYTREYFLYAGLATGFTAAPHILMSMLLIVRQGWLQAASQACGFILTLNPFESLSPIPEGILGLFVISVGFIAYVLIAASGLIFVAYCVVCYLVTALLFSLLILDLAALVVTVAPTKGIFKYTDLVYTENFKFTRLVLQSWLQSLPQLVLLCWILYCNLNPAGPAIELNGAIVILAAAAHIVNVWDKAALFGGAVRATGAGVLWHLLYTLALKGGHRVSRPVLEENLSRMMRSSFSVHVSSFEDPDDVNSEQAASMVPEYLTPSNGGLLAPGQLMTVMRAAFVRFSGAGVWELVLEVSRDVRVGKLMQEACAAFPNLFSVRFVNATLCGNDAHLLADALLSCQSLGQLQIQQAKMDAKGGAAIAKLLESTPTLQQLDLCRCEVRGRVCGPLARGIRANRTLQQLNLSGTALGDAGGAAIAAALKCNKVLAYVNLAFCQLGKLAVDELSQALSSSSGLHVLAVSLPEVPPASAHQLVQAIQQYGSMKITPSIECHLPLGSFNVIGLDRVQFLCVQDQEALVMDAWQGLTGGGPSQLRLGPLAGGWHQQGGNDDNDDNDDNNDNNSESMMAQRQQQQQQGEGQGHGAADSSMHDELGGSHGSQEAGGSYGEIDGRSSGNADGQEVQEGVSGHHTTAVGTADRPDVHDSSSGPDPSEPGSMMPTANNSCSPDQASGMIQHAVHGRSGIGLCPAAAASTAAASPATAGSMGHTDVVDISGASSTTPSQNSNTVHHNHHHAAAGGAYHAAQANMGAGPTLCFVVCQEDVVKSLTQVPLFFDELDTLDLTGLGVGDEGATALRDVLCQNPPLSRLVLTDNGLSKEGAVALADALESNSNLKVLDLSSNEFDDDSVISLAAATQRAAGLSSLVLLGNKIPFALPTLRALMQAEKAAPHVHLVLVEDAAAIQELMEQLHQEGRADVAADFYTKQEQFREQRRQRKQRRRQLREQRRRYALATSDNQATEALDMTTSQTPSPRPTMTTTSVSDPGSTQTAAPANVDSPQLAVAALPAAAGDATASRSSSSPASASGDGNGSGVGGASPPGSFSSGSSADEDTCGVCFDNETHVAIKFCGHRLCVDCYRKVWELSSGVASCPFCRSKIEGYMYLDWPLE